MTHNTMRRIDTCLGAPLCFLLTLHRRLAEGLRLRRQPATPGKILVIKFFGMGSILVAGPALRALRASFPEAKVVFLTFPQNQEIVRLCRCADEVLLLRTAGLLPFVGSVLKLIWRLRREQFDAVVDLEFFAKFTMILSYLTGAPVRLGFYARAAYRGDLLTHRSPFNPYHHMTRIYADMVSEIRNPKSEIRNLDYPELPVDDDARQRVRQMLAEAGCDRRRTWRGGYEGSDTGPTDARPTPDAHKPLIVLNPNVSELALLRRWDGEKFAQLAARCSHDLQATIVFIGARDDVAHVQGVVRRLPSDAPVVNLAARTSLAELIELLRLADVLVSSDSGPVHLAACVGAPVVALFGPETPVLYGPLGAQHRVIHRDLHCSPCLNVYDGKTPDCRYGNVCMKSIGAEEVYEALVSALRERAAVSLSH